MSGRLEPGQDGVYTNRAVSKLGSDQVLRLLQRRSRQPGTHALAPVCIVGHGCPELACLPEVVTVILQVKIHLKSQQQS